VAPACIKGYINGDSRLGPRVGDASGGCEKEKDWKDDKAMVDKECRISKKRKYRRLNRGCLSRH